jgi:hypothetical protein
VLDLRSLGLLHRARAPPAASTALSATSVGFMADFSSALARVAPRATVSAGFFFFFFGGLGVFWGLFL